jgi:hypothetical protein
MDVRDVTRESWDSEVRGMADPNSDPEWNHAKSRLSLFEVCSFVVFCVLCLVGMAAFAAYYLLFVGLLVLDGAATFWSIDTVVSIDRSILFFGLIILTALWIPNILLLTFEILALFAILDMSLFLRRLADTRIETSVLKRRLQSYTYTMVPAFLLSYVLISLFSIVPVDIVPQSSALFVLAASSVGAFVTVWLVTRYLSSLARGDEPRL